MSEIRGEIILGIGVVVVIVSLIQPTLGVFVYVGGGMALWGLGKAIFRKIRGPKQVAHAPHTQTHPNNHQHATYQQHSTHQQHHQAHHTHAHAGQAHSLHANQHRPVQQHGQQPQQHQHMHQQFHPHSIVQKNHGHAPTQQHSVKKCPNCQTVMPMTYRHCPQCGYGV